jgi:hypothetical protein
MNKGRLIFIAILMLFSTAALFAWYYLPIYPDEIAVQLISGRYIQDHGLAQNLFHICPANARETPLLFVIPAWIYSWLCLHLSLIEMRILPFATTLAAIFLTIWFTVKGRNPAAAILATTALIGVAGSGLIIARAEYWQVLNVACCAWVFLHLESTSLRTGMRYGLAVLLLLSCLLSIYSHIQGLIFLPLSFYLIFRLVSPKTGWMCSAILLASLFIFGVITTVNFHNFSCDGYPGIEHYRENMVISIEKLKLDQFIDWLVTNITNYFQPFYFQDSYQINYLPGIQTSDSWLKNLLSGLNQSIHIILMVNLILFVCAAISASIFAIKQYVTTYKLRGTNGGAITKGLDEAHAIILFAFPLICLFFFDANHNFYRSFFINLLVVIMLTMLLSRINLGRLRAIATTYFVLCGVVVMASLAVNVWWFTDKLHAGFEGPSMSINKNWDDINRDVLSLAQDCGMDLSKGRIIVDDMTYDSLKRYPLIYPITYLYLSGSLANLTNAEVISRARPNFAIVRCDYLRFLGIPPQKTRNQFCGVNFLDGLKIYRLPLKTLTPFTNETTLTYFNSLSEWHPPEKLGTWTASPKANLHIPLANDPGGDLLVALDVEFLNLPGVKNRLRITAKGQELFSENYAEGGGGKKVVFRYPRQLLGNDHTLLMTLESDTHVHAELQSETRDIQHLGVFLTAVWVDTVPSIRVGERQPVTEKGPFYLLVYNSDWNPPEKLGTWTASPKAKLHIPLANDPGGDLLVTLDVEFLNLPGVKNRLRITAKGQELFSENFPEGVGGKKVVFRYPRQLLRNDHTLLMTLESDTHVHAELQPETGDNRYLGVFLTAVLVDKVPSIRIGERQPVTEKSPFYLLVYNSDWNPPEKLGTWTASPQAKLHIPLAEDPGGDLLVTLDVEFLNLPGVKNRLRITAKGQELFSESFPEGMDGKKILFTYPRQLLGNDHTLLMTLESDTHVRAELQPETRDTRHLGVFLIAVLVEKLPSIPSIRIGERQPVTEKSPFYLLVYNSDWNPPEKLGTWTASPQAKLHIPLAEDPGGDLLVTLDVEFLNLPGVKNRLRITAKGQELFSENYAEGGGGKKIVFRYPRQLLGNDHTLLMTLESDTHVRAELQPETRDTRHLGVFLIAVLVEKFHAVGAPSSP